MIRALIVDDERLACKRLQTLLSAHPQIHVVGEAHDLATAAQCIAQEQPHLVFLDIQMPPSNGFDLIPLLPLTTGVVFVTAYDMYALRAFEAGALDYLLKPVAPARLAATITRLERTLQRPQEHVLIGDSRNWIKVHVREITAITAEQSYTQVLTVGAGTHLVRRTMQEWLQVLPGDFFIRADRSLLVNRERITGFKTKNRDRGELLLEGNPAPIQLGRIAIQTLRRQISTAPLGSQVW